MKPGDALARAIRLWGSAATVKDGRCAHHRLGTRRGIPVQGPTFCWSHGPASGCPGGRPWRQVGRIELGLFFMVRGDGDTWEQAFARALERYPASTSSPPACAKRVEPR
jgi:hypothetical protein